MNNIGNGLTPSDQLASDVSINGDCAPSIERSTRDLKKFLELAKATTSAQALADIIKQVLESPSIYVFGELLDIANIKALAGTEFEPYLRLLNIFAYDKYSDYQRRKQELSLPELSQPMITKLRQLSIVSLARSQRHISYQTLLQELDIANIRQLEDVIIDVIYANVIKGTMDQKNSRLEIDQTIGRDVRMEDFDSINSVLNDWCRNCDNILANMEHQMSSANQFKDSSALAKQALESKIAAARKNLKITENDDAIMTDATNVYIRDSAPEKIKRNLQQKHFIKSGHKVVTKSWRKDN